MSLTRKQFLQGAASGTVVLLVQGCGGGGSGYGGMASANGSYGGMPMQITGCAADTITNNHGHALSIPMGDLNSTTDKAYSIQGMASHDHTITLTTADFATLKAGGTVTVRSTVTTAPVYGTHSHDVTVACM